MIGVGGKTLSMSVKDDKLPIFQFVNDCFGLSVEDYIAVNLR